MASHLSLTSFTESLGPRPKGEFRPVPLLCEKADTLTLYFENSPSYAVRIDNFVTLFKSIETDDLVGFTLKGIHRKMKELHALIISAENPRVQVCLILMAYAAEPHADRETMNDLIDKTRSLDAPVPVS